MTYMITMPQEMHDRSDRCAYHHPPLLLPHRNDDIHDLNHCGREEDPRDSWPSRPKRQDSGC